MQNITKTESEAEIICPTAHLNGSGKGALLEQYQKAREAIWNAQKAMSDASPHARDYYVQENEITPSGKAIQRAAIEHRLRLMKLNQIEEELNAIIFNLYDQRG